MYSQQYEAALQAIDDAQFDTVRAQLAQLQDCPDLDDRQRAQVANDLAVLAALRGDWSEARQGWERALQLNPAFALPRDNLATLQQAQVVPDLPVTSLPSVTAEAEQRPVRISVLSFLFNWPSTGGGIVHTVELCTQLARAGYEVQHVYARFADWGIGTQTEPLPYEPCVLEFHSRSWNLPEIQARYHQAVAEFAPDYVIITDSWNMKPLLAEALGGQFPYFLRLQSQECLCPLNNTRLLWEQGQFRQCRQNQLATAETCHQCLTDRQRQSGPLHQRERQLAGVGTRDYDQSLRRAVAEAEAVLVLNPLIGQLFEPYAREVRVVTWGMDPARFPWPWAAEPPQLSERPYNLFMAGVVQEATKGFEVLHEACRRLWARRQDFSLVATGAPMGAVDPFTRFTGWLSQAELPRYLRAADVVVVPAIAQEALARTSVEAMAVGRPVLGSRIGGIPYTVTDEVTGLLFESGNPDDLASKLDRLLDDQVLRNRLGAAGRQRFEEAFTWDGVIQRQYRPLLARKPLKHSTALMGR